MSALANASKMTLTTNPSPSAGSTAGSSCMARILHAYPT
jgi:hypothetical protein